VTPLITTTIKIQEPKIIELFLEKYVDINKKDD
jgi:hypothetical protein